MNRLNVNKEIRYIHKALVTGIVLEPSLEPSLGLVCPTSMGSHDDMNFFSFLIGSASMSSYLHEIIEYGFIYDDTNVLREVRSLGIKMEKDLLNSTGGINTQKGLVFLASILGLGAASSFKEIGFYKSSHILKKIEKITRGLVEKELDNKEKLETHGEKVYTKYKLKGIRGEVESGLPSVRDVGYPVFKANIESGLSLEKSMLDTLLNLMGRVEDSTIVHRSSIEELYRVQTIANEVVELGAFRSKEGRVRLSYLNEYLIKNKLSPGGSADLLSICISLYLLENEKFNLTSIL